MRFIPLICLFATMLSACKNENKNTVVVDNKGENLSKKNAESITVSKIDVVEIPETILYEGKFKEGYKWSDANGQNIVFLTETGIIRDKNKRHEFEGSGDAELFAYSYHLNDGIYQIRWKIYDFVEDCPVDIVAKFIENTLKITDLDDNGTAEIWTMYKTVCHGDVSPSDMKIIMYEGDQKYALRGENKVQTGIDDNGKPQYLGGEYKMDEKFKKGSEVFRSYAEKLWNENILETWK